MSNLELINHLRARGVLKTPSVISAFGAVDRADFVLEEYRNQAYEDYPLPIGYGQTISQPTTVAFMLELLQPQEGDKVLDVGSGSGWTTALLSCVVGEKGCVVGVEKIPELVDFGLKNIEKYGVKNAVVLQAEEHLGLSKETPFDKILVSASASIFPEELLYQLVVGGRLVVPVGHSIFKVDKLSEAEIKKEEFPGFVFVPLI